MKKITFILFAAAMMMVGCNSQIRVKCRRLSGKLLEFDVV